MLLFSLLLTLAPQDFTVWPGNVRVEATGQTVQTGTRYSLAEALELAAADQASSGDAQTIVFSGFQERLGVGIGTGVKKWEAVSPTGFEDIAVIGGDSTAIIGDIHLGGTDAIRGIGFENVTIRPIGGLQAGVLAYAWSTGGTIRFRNCLWQTDARTKWGVRGHGSFGWEFTDCDFPDGGQEHAMYLDNVQGATVQNVTATGWKRTAAQFVVRTFPHTRPSSGNVLISKLIARDCGEHGASAITVAGHVGGTFRIEDCTIIGDNPAGGIVAYLDVKQKELSNPKGPKPFNVIGPGYTNPNGFAIDHLIVRNCYMQIDGDRDFIALGSIELAEVIVAQLNQAFIAGPKSALDIEHNGQANGTVVLRSRASPNGWNWQTPENFVQNGVPFDPDTLWDAP